MLISFASDENILGFGSKRMGLTPNIPLAKNKDYEDWNIATLGFLDRLELTLEQGFHPFSEPKEFDYEAIRTINIGSGIPFFRFGTLGLGLGVIEDDSGTNSLLYPYLAYSRHFKDRLSLGIAYSIETPQSKIGTVDNTKYFKQNSLEQFGVILKLFKYVRMGFNIENQGYLDDIESVRPGIALVLAEFKRNFMFNSFYLGSDLDFSLNDIFLFKSSKYSLHNLHLDVGIETRYFSIEGGFFKDLSNKSLPLEGSLCFTISLPFRSNNPIDANYSVQNAIYNNQNFLTQKFNLTVGDSVEGKWYMKKADELMDKFQMENAIDCFDTSKDYLISQTNIQHVNDESLKASQMLKNNRDHYQNGIKFTKEGKLDVAINELNKIPYWSQFYDSAKQNLSNLNKQKEKLDYITDLYQQGIGYYHEREFDKAYNKFNDILGIDAFYKDSKQKSEICQKLSKADEYYKKGSYDETIKTCDLILKSYPNEPMIKILHDKSEGYINYIDNKFQQAIEFWSLAQRIDKESGNTVDTNIEKNIIKAKEQITARKIKADLFYREAKLDYENEKYEEAEQKSKKCLEIDPDHDDSKSLLIDIYKDILSKVRSSYSKALVDPSGNILKDIKPKLSLIAGAEYADPKDIACAYIYLGAIQVVFEKDDNRGKDMFIKALNTYPKSELTNDINDSDIKKVFDEARREFFLRLKINGQ